MRNMKPLFSILLAWAMLLGMVSISTGAVESNYKLSIVNVQTFPAGTTAYHADAATSTSAQKDEIVVVSVGFQNNTASAAQIGSFDAQLNYDTGKLETYNLFGDTFYQAGADFSSGWTVLGNALATAVNIGGFALGNAKVTSGDTTVIGRFAFRVKAQEGTAQFTFQADATSVADGNGDELTPLGGLAAKSLKIGKDSGDSATPAPTPIVRLGDVDEDGDVTAIDARIALHMASGVIDEKNQTTKQKTVADVDKDGYVTAIDARMILQFASGVLETFD